MIIDQLLLSQEEILNKINEAVKKQESLLLTYFNQNSFNIYFKNKRYKELLDKHFKVYQADSGIYIFLRFIKKKKIARIDATSLNKDILKEIIKHKISVSFIGGNFKENFLREECKKREINFAGYHQGYFEKEQSFSVIEFIKKLNSQVYFIGMGVPQQEFFAYQLSRNSTSKILICVGNFLEFYFGTQKRAPVIFQKSGFEWLFRLFSEPKRIWKRYLIGVPKFFILIFRNFILKNSHE